MINIKKGGWHMNEKKSVDPKLKKALYIAIAGLLAISFYQAHQGQNDPEQENYVDAILITRKYIEGNLKAPSSVQHPVFSQYKITKTKNGKYVVSAYFEAQNSFGVMLRTNYSAILRPSGDKWYVDNFFYIKGKDYIDKVNH